jgi:hypothetical protein
MLGASRGNPGAPSQEWLCRDGDWVVLEPTVAEYGTGVAAILYYALVRLDNLGRCVDSVAAAGDGKVRSSYGLSALELRHEPAAE